VGASKDAALIRINQTVPRLRQFAYLEVVNAAEFKCLFERLGDPAPLYLRRRKPLSALGFFARRTRRQLEVSCFSVTTRMRRQVNGIIGPLTILGPTNRD
jgi:hypothetical protein